MKKVGIVYFTNKGKQLAEKIGSILSFKGYEIHIRDKARDENLKKWTESAMENFQIVIFISATGIAVRAIAPYLKSKTLDPPVISIDDNGKFVIPLVSGHLGGANELAKMLAKELESIPVITTATDINGKIPIDSWAKANNLVIEDMDRAKECAMRLLENKSIGLWSIVPVECQAEGIDLAILNKFNYTFGINISWEIPKMFKRELKLVPKGLVLGIGCRRGISSEKVEEVVRAVLMENGICFSGISTVATIDLKENEEGLLKFVDKYKMKFQVFSSEQLSKVPGNFPQSKFVEQITGVDNVCQRAALCAEPGGQVILEKIARDGVTVSVVVPRRLREEILYVK